MRMYKEDLLCLMTAHIYTTKEVESASHALKVAKSIYEEVFREEIKQIEAMAKIEEERIAAHEQWKKNNGL